MSALAIIVTGCSSSLISLSACEAEAISYEDPGTDAAEGGKIKPRSARHTVVINDVRARRSGMGLGASAMPSRW